MEVIGVNQLVLTFPGGGLVDVFFCNFSLTKKVIRRSTKWVVLRLYAHLSFIYILYPHVTVVVVVVVIMALKP